jgi:hypothetical protein
MQQADWKSADEVAEAIMSGEATHQLSGLRPGLLLGVVRDVLRKLGASIGANRACQRRISYRI